MHFSGDTGPPFRRGKEPRSTRATPPAGPLVAVDKNSTVVFPAPLMSTIQELGAFLAKEGALAEKLTVTSTG